MHPLLPMRGLGANNLLLLFYDDQRYSVIYYSRICDRCHLNSNISWNIKCTILYHLPGNTHLISLTMGPSVLIKFSPAKNSTAIHDDATEEYIRYLECTYSNIHFSLWIS